MRIKVINVVLILSLIVFPLFLRAKPICDYTIDSSITRADASDDNSIDEMGKGFSDIQPGNTVCISAGERNSLELRNFHGKENQPIVFTNVGGKVSINVTFTSHNDEGIDVSNSQYIHITGTGDPSIEYGISIVEAEHVGLRLSEKTSNFEIDHIEVANIQRVGDAHDGSGIWAQTQSTCPDASNVNYDYDGDGLKQGDLDDVVNKGNFTQVNSIIHHNYIHDVDAEGIYLGSSHWPLGNAKSKLTCGGKEPDPDLNGVQVFDNVIERSGWDGIQISSTPKNCTIHDNTVVNDSMKCIDSQMGGIRNGPGSMCHIYNNTVIDGNGPGIRLGARSYGGNKIYNNVIVRSGPDFLICPEGITKNGSPVDQGIDGIQVSSAFEPAEGYLIFNNTIIDSQRNGIGYFNDTATQNDSLIQNNIIVNAEEKYIHTGSRTNVQFDANLEKSSSDAVKFIDAAHDDYHLQSISVAKDTGLDLTGMGIIKDHNGVDRPQYDNFDKGAYEYILSPTLVLPPKQWRQISLPLSPPIGADTLEAVFGDDISGKYDIDWALFTYDPVSNGYINPGLKGIVTQGTGYWIIQLTEAETILDLPEESTFTPIIRSSQCVSVNGCFEITLATRLNAKQRVMFGHPFTGGVHWNNLRVTTTSGGCTDADGCTLNEAKDLGIFHNQAWSYNPITGAYEIIENTALLTRWNSYWGTTLINADGLNPKLLVPLE